MASNLATFRFEWGGMCYVACQEAYVWYNSSQHWCRKGCDFAKGRVNDPILRLEAENMCKQITLQSYYLQKHEDLDNINDYRIHAHMYPENATNMFKACLSGIRRQLY